MKLSIILRKSIDKLKNNHLYLSLFHGTSLFTENPDVVHNNFEMSVIAEESMPPRMIDVTLVAVVGVVDDMTAVVTERRFSLAVPQSG